MPSTEPATTAATTTTTEATTTTTTEATTTTDAPTTTDATTHHRRDHDDHRSDHDHRGDHDDNGSLHPVDLGGPNAGGLLAVSPDAFAAVWNVAAEPKDVASISTWTQEPLAGNIGNVADLGDNLRLVLLSARDDGPVAAAVLAWMPLSDPAQQAQQNTAYQDAFAVLVKTVNISASAEEQATVAAQLGLSNTEPPFPEGASATTSLESQQYQLAALVPSGSSGVYTLAGVYESP